MKRVKNITALISLIKRKPALIILLFLGGCIVPYDGDFAAKEISLVVEGGITDRSGPNTVRLYRSRPLSDLSQIVPVMGCRVWLTDDENSRFTLREGIRGQYSTDPAEFRGIPGRKYVLHIETGPSDGNLLYESYPTEMQPVAAIDSLYYEKTETTINNYKLTGCDIKLNSGELEGKSAFMRWGYTETWEFHIPFNVPDGICWKSAQEEDIILTNTKRFSEGRIIGFPVRKIPNPVDRLLVKYSILVEQLSLNEEEFLYWTRLEKLSSETGGLYDIVPSDVPNNLFCPDDPSRKVLGYFSVSAVSSERLFINEKFRGVDQSYFSCLDTIFNNILPTDRIFWIVERHPEGIPPYTVITYSFDCIDCSKAGSPVRPDFWDDDKKGAR